MLPPMLTYQRSYKPCTIFGRTLLNSHTECSILCSLTVSKSTPSARKIVVFSKQTHFKLINGKIALPANRPCRAWTQHLFQDSPCSCAKRDVKYVLYLLQNAISILSKARNISSILSSVSMAAAPGQRSRWCDLLNSADDPFRGKSCCECPCIRFPFFSCFFFFVFFF